jgi:hypothetical protein
MEAHRQGPGQQRESRQGTDLAHFLILVSVSSAGAGFVFRLDTTLTLEKGAYGPRGHKLLKHRFSCDLQHVHKHEQQQPHHVNEVPVPGHPFKGKVALGRKMSLH